MSEYRIAIFSDMHGNSAATETVLAAIEAEAPDETLCLGDLVGYGARPNEVIDLVLSEMETEMEREATAGIDATDETGEAGGEASSFEEPPPFTQDRTGSPASASVTATSSASELVGFWTMVTS